MPLSDIHIPASASLSERKGRVLRIKHGYNPNSSSVGTAIVFVLPTMVIASSVLFGGISAVMMNALIRNLEDKEKTDETRDAQNPS